MNYAKLPTRVARIGDAVKRFDQPRLAYKSVGHTIKTPDGDTEYLRKKSGVLFTFDVRENAAAIAVPDGEVVEVDG